MKTPDEIKKSAEICGKEWCWMECPYFREKECVMNLLSDALAYIEQLEEKQQWISIKDRPPKAGKILVTDGETVTISNGAWLYRTLDGKTRVPANYGAGLTVTHWMPRPVPPKEEKEASLEAEREAKSHE